jgi:hypothetical protein
MKNNACCGLYITAAIATVLLFLVGQVTPVYAQYVGPHTKPGPALDSITFKRVPLDLAGAAVENKEIDAYIFGLRPAQAKTLLSRSSLRVLERLWLHILPSGTMITSLTLT